MSRIEIAGCIASGKTTLANMLSGRSIVGVQEDHTINPFWQAFYTNPSTCTFEAEITFLLQHYHFAKLTALKSKNVMLLDHSFELDMAYAEIGLETPRKEIFSLIYREIISEIGLPRVLILISCRADQALRRIQGRGRSFENNITLEFLADLQRAVERRIAKIASCVPVIEIDSESTDFRKDGPWRSDLINRLCTLSGIPLSVEENLKH